MLENTVFDKDYFLFTIDFKNLYTNISVKDAIKIIKELFFRYQNVILNTHFIYFLDRMELVLICAIMKFQEDFFRQILGIVIGTNLAPILNTIYMAILEENITWPKVFKRFIDDGFGVIKSNKKRIFAMG